MPTILIVEDAQDLARMVKGELEECGYRVLHAGDGEEALRIFQNAHLDLVILDWRLPKLDGLEVLRRIRQSSGVPVMMLTARKEEIDRVTGLEVGADDYLTKPFGMRELVARVHALLRRMQNIQAVVNADQKRPAAPFTCGALQLDPSAYLASLDGVPLDLTRIEFDLLCLLARNPGRVFNRSYLLETVWGENYLSGDRSVDNAVLRLRKKLGPYAGVIEAIWGIGYRFNLPGT
jgi:DNA-binding response OmpR family regulator